MASGKPRTAERLRWSDKCLHSRPVQLTVGLDKRPIVESQLSDDKGAKPEGGFGYYRGELFTRQKRSNDAPNPKHYQRP